MSAATDYLQSYENYFWRYEDQGKVIAVPDGRTIGYTDQIINEIVFHLAAQGLPRFGSLLLAITATTTHGTDALEDIVRIVEARAKRTEEVEKGIWFLKLLAQVPPKMKQGNLRILLLQAVFMHRHNGVGRKNSTQILEELRIDPSIAQYPAARREKELTKLRMITSMINDFKTLAIISQELKDVPTILECISNLPSVTHAVGEMELEPRLKDQEDGFFDQLLDHHDTFHVGALVANLMSGLQISFHASLPSEQPLGGVADITNKGSFDKLLTSEYAFDDHVLLSRLANSEALYKHREVPPTDNNRTRVLLIDTTLQNWGTVRTISFATALAIAHHPRNKFPCRVFLVGQSYWEIAVATVTDIIEGLNYLDSSLDPGVGLESLFYREDLRGCEIFFLGTAASLTVPGMQRMMADPGKRIDFWIHPDEQGVLKLYLHPKRGKRLVQELSVPIEQIWSKTKGRKAGKPSLGATSYPILFPETRMKAIWTGKRFTYGLTKYKALVRLFAGHVDTTHGWEFITGGIRPMDNLKAVLTHDDLSVTVLFGTDKKEYSVITYPEGERIPVALDRRMIKVRDFYVEDNCFKSDLEHITVCVDLQGQVSEEASPKQKHTNWTPVRCKPTNFFRQVTRVSITMDDKLRFRKHDLLLDNGGIVIQHRGSGIGDKLTAVQNEAGTFTFPDGSFVVHNDNGILSLQSADAALPEIHLPTQLNTHLGLATADVYSGRSYYRLEPRIEVFVNDVSNRVSQVASLVVQCVDRVTLQQAKLMVINGLISCPDEASLAKLESVLAGFSYRIQRRGIEQREIPPTAFYHQYIESFITHIVNHGTEA